MQNQSKPLDETVLPAAAVYRAQPYTTVAANLKTREMSQLHFHDHMELGFCCAGTGLDVIGNEFHSFTAPCLIFHYPYEYHMTHTAKGANASFRFISFSPEQVLSSYPADSLRRILPAHRVSPELCVVRQDNAPRILSLAEIFSDELRECGSVLTDSGRALLYAILSMNADRIRGPARSQAGAGRDYMPMLASILNSISRRYCDPSLSVSGIAKEFAVSESTLRRWFLHSLGISPLDYLHKLRVFAAKSLLIGSSRSVMEISMEVGYESQSSFNRHFLRLCGVSPLQYRKSGVHD